MTYKAKQARWFQAFERLTGDQLEQMESVAQLKTMLQNHITYGTSTVDMFTLGVTVAGDLQSRYRRDSKTTIAIVSR